MTRSSSQTRARTTGSYERVVDALFHLAKFVNGRVPLHELLPEVARAAAELVGGDSASIALLDRNGRYLLNKASYGLSKKEAEIAFPVGEGVAGWVAEHQQPALVPDVLQERRFRRIAGQTTALRTLLCVPLMTAEGLLGVMSVGHARPSAFTQKDQELLVYLATSVVKDLDNARLYRMSITDAMTQAFNRQYLAQKLPDESERSRRYGSALSVIVFDVDHFKRLNDTYGHDVGDAVLKELVQRVQGSIREVDALVRSGGEEFVVICPNTLLEGALELAERLRLAVEGAPFRVGGPELLPVTISLGVATYEPGRDESERDFLRRADQMLYRAKAAGRNRVVADRLVGKLPLPLTVDAALRRR